MLQTVSPFLVPSRAAQIILAASVAALLSVFILQYVFGVDPCILCWWQRLPYALTLMTSLIAWLWRPYGPQTRGLVGACALIFAVGAVLAFFHTGVEQHWWLGTSGCSIQPLHGTNPEDLREELLHTVVAHCDQISWTFLGLSLANWNVAASIILATFSGTAALRK